jgi:hypothetical protein
MAKVIAGARSWLWRAVDNEGEILDLFVQRSAQQGYSSESEDWLTSTMLR